jgi:hypothetical protein
MSDQEIRSELHSFLIGNLSDDYLPTNLLSYQQVAACDLLYRSKVVCRIDRKQVAAKKYFQGSTNTHIDGYMNTQSGRA